MPFRYFSSLFLSTVKTLTMARVNLVRGLAGVGGAGGGWRRAPEAGGAEVRGGRPRPAKVGGKVGGASGAGFLFC